MAINVKDWEKTRPAECKGSGVGEACKNWTKFCLPDIQKVGADDKATSDAVKTIEAFFKALKAAEGKLAKCKKPEAVSATKELIKKWNTEISNYHKALTAAALKATATEHEDALQDRMTKASEKFLATILGGVTTLKENTAKLLNEGEAALKKKDYGLAEQKITSALHKLKFQESLIFKPDESLQISIKEAGGGIPANRLNLSVFSGEHGKLVALWKEYKVRAQNLQKQWEELNDGADPVGPDQSKLDTQTKIKTNTIVDLYKKTIGEMTLVLGKMDKLVVQSKQINGNPLLTKNPDGMITVISKALQSLKEVEEEAKQVLFHIREGEGKCVKKRKDLFGPEDSKYAPGFLPFINRGITINGKVSQGIDAATEQLKEALETIVSGGSKAAADAQKLLGTL